MDPYITISGFGEAEHVEKKSRFIGQAFPVTSEEEVRRILDDTKKSFWDASHHCYAYRLGLEGERFALVSLDADLEESTLAGLRFFLPRMSAGGYLLLHDWNNPKLPGVRRALARWEAEHGRLAAVPLCDVNGTLVIAV